MDWDSEEDMWWSLFEATSSVTILVLGTILVIKVLEYLIATA